MSVLCLRLHILYLHVLDLRTQSPMFCDPQWCTISNVVAVMLPKLVKPSATSLHGSLNIGDCLTELESHCRDLHTRQLETTVRPQVMPLVLIVLKSYIQQHTTPHDECVRASSFNNTDPHWAVRIAPHHSCVSNVSGILYNCFIG